MSITIKTDFIVPRPAELTWPALTDIELAAPCFPGAELQGQQPDGSYKGKFTVKLGPLTFQFNGKFRIAEQDDAQRVARVEASGTDAKGRGGANASIAIKLLPQGEASRVEVVSDVTLSGAVAQYGRGTAMIEALSKQLLEQFSANLTARIAQQQPAAASVAPVAARQDAAAATAQVPASAPVAAPPVAPLDAGALMRRAMWQSFKAFFARLFGRHQRT